MHKIKNDPINNDDLVNKKYVDNAIKDNNIKTYTNISQLGLTTPITVGDLFVGLPDNSLLRMPCDNDEITGVPHKNGVLIIDKCDSSKFSIEFKISAGGSVNDNTLYIGQLKGVDGTGLSWQRVCTTNDTDIHVTTGDKAKWNEVTNKINKTDITTTINSTSTDTQVPSAKSVYDNAIKDKNIKTYTNVSQLGLKYPITVGEIFNAMPANSIAHLMADTSSTITDCPSTNGILIIDKCYMSKFSIEFKISASGETATNILYIGQLKGADGTGLSWQRVCTTKAADVNKTSITSNNTDLYTIGQAYYCVKNGICYINFWPITVKKTGGSIKTGKIFPHPLLVRASGALVDGNGNFGGQAYIGENGELRFDCALANTELYCTISYPVENS